MAHPRTGLAAHLSADGFYVEARGRAQSAPTLWLRWQARRLARRSDSRAQARYKAVRLELHQRGVR